MKIIIAGAGNVGTHLAKLLSREKQDIILMDDDEEKLTALSSNFDLLTVTASPSSISGLKEVGVKEADLFIAVTPDESRNMTACMLATNLGAKKTVARIDNYEYLLPKNKEFFQKLGVDSLIYPEMLAAKEIVSSMRMSWVRQLLRYFTVRCSVLVYKPTLCNFLKAEPREGALSVTIAFGSPNCLWSRFKKA